MRRKGEIIFIFKILLTNFQEKTMPVGGRGGCRQRSSEDDKEDQ